MSHPFSPWRSDAPNAPPQVHICSALQLFWFIFSPSLLFPRFSLSAFSLFLSGFVFFDLDSSFKKAVVQLRHWCCCVWWSGDEMTMKLFPYWFDWPPWWLNCISSIWSSLPSCVMYNLSHFFSRERSYICAQTIQMCPAEDMMTLSPDDRQWTYWAQQVLY